MYRQFIEIINRYLYIPLSYHEELLNETVLIERGIEMYGDKGHRIIVSSGEFECYYTTPERFYTICNRLCGDTEYEIYMDKSGHYGDIVRKNND